LCLHISGYHQLVLSGGCQLGVASAQGHMPKLVWEGLAACEYFSLKTQLDKRKKMVSKNGIRKQ